MEELENISSRIRDELGETKFFQITKSHMKYYDPIEILVGKEIANQFPSTAIFEMDEAAKCLALDRSTACVFHLMRLLEIAVGAIRQCLGIPDSMKPADRNWGKILKRIKEEIDRRNGQNPPCWSSGNDAEFFEGVYASLDAVKNVWRNATMHVESKYTAEEAEHIWNATYGLMRKLASRLDENGSPAA